MNYRKKLYQIMTAFFLILLLVPAFGIFREKRNVDLIAIMENRTINPKPGSAFATKQFFREFQNWFEDRLLGRKDLIHFWSNINGKLFHVLISKEVVEGRNGFLFNPSYVTNHMNDRKQKLLQFALIKRICDTYNVPFVFCLTPHGEWMLGEDLPHKQKPADIAKIETELGTDLQKSGIDYCMFGSKMARLPAKERQSMYIKGDYHWNSKGAFFGTKELLRHIKLNKAIDNPVLYEVEERTQGDIYTRKIGRTAIKSVVKVPWSDAYTKDFYIESHEGSDVLKDQGNGQKGERIVRNPKATYNITALVLGDSFFTLMEKYLMQDIGTIVFCHNREVRKPKKNIDLERMIQTYKPNIVIYEKAGFTLFVDSYHANFGSWKQKIHK